MRTLAGVLCMRIAMALVGYVKTKLYEVFFGLVKISYLATADEMRLRL